MATRKYTRNEKVFYIVSLLVIVSMVVGSLAMAIAPSF